MPQSIIGSLRVSLGLDSAQFEAGARRATASADGLRGKVAGLATVVARVAVPAALAAGAIGAIGRAGLQTAREVQTLSQLAGVQPALFQRWAAAARTVGIEQGKLADILKDTQDRVGDFLQTGGGPMADFFEKIAPRIGVTAQQFRGLSGPDALQLYVSSLEKANLNQQEMTFYLEAVASDATALIPLLRDNGREMELLGDRAERLGTVLDDAAIAKMNEAQASIDKASEAWRGMANDISVAVAPALQSAAEGFTSVLAVARPALQFLAAHLDRIAVYATTAAVAFGTSFAVAIGVAAVRTLTLARALVTLRGALVRTGIGALVILAGEAVYRLSDVTKEVGGVGNALGLLGDVAGEVWQRIGDGTTYVTESVRAMALGAKAAFIGAVGSMASAWVEFTWTIADGLNSLFDLNVRGADATITQDLGRAYNETASAASAASAAASAAAASFAAPLQSLQALRDATSGTAEETGVLEDRLDGLSTALDGSGAGGAGSGGGGGGAAGAAGEAAQALKELKNEIAQLEFDADPVAKYRFELSHLDKLLAAGLSPAAYAHAVVTLNEGLSASIPMVDDVAGAFGDWVSRGFQDFKTLTASIIGSFQSMLSDMVAMALRNRIIVPIALGGGGAGAGAAGLLGSFGEGGSILGVAGLGGGSGFLGGLGNALSGGLSNVFNVGANAAGGGFMASLGAAMPIVAGVGLAFAALRKRTETLDEGLRLTVDGLDSVVQAYEKTRSTRLFGLISRTSTDYSSVDSETQSALSSAVAAIQRGVVDTAGALKIGGAAFEAFSYRMEISTEGMSRTEAIEAVRAELGELSDEFAAMIPGLQAWSTEGEGAAATLGRITTALGTFNASALLVDARLQAMSVRGAGLASTAIEAAGGMQAFEAAASAFASGFLSEEERIAGQTRQLTAAFGEIGLVLPRSRAEFRALVEGIDTTSVAGAQLYGQVLSMASAFIEATPAVANLTAEMQGLLGTVQTNLDAALSAVGEQARANRSAAEAWYRTADTLRGVIADMRGTASALISGEQARAFAEARFQTTLSGALAGDAAAAGDLPAAARALLQATEATAATRIDMARAEARVLSDLQLAAGVSDLEGAGRDVTAGLQERQVDILEDIRDGIRDGSLGDKQLARWQAALGALDGAIKAVDSISYADVRARLDVVVDATAEMPPWLATALGNAAAGISADVEFVVRAEGLTPELRWIALTGSSEHLATVEFVADNRMPRALAELALVKSANVARRVRAVLDGGSDEGAVRVALLTAAETQRVIGVELAARFDGSTPRGIKDLAALIRSGSGKLTLDGGFSFDPSKAFVDAIGAGVRSPVGALVSSLEVLRLAIVGEAARQKAAASAAGLLGKVAATNTTGPNGELFLRDDQTRNVAKALGFDASADLGVLRAQIAGASGTDMVRQVLSTADLKARLVDYALNHNLPIRDAEYRRRFNLPTGVSAAQHFDTIGRYQIASWPLDARLGIQKLFDFGSHFANVPGFASGTSFAPGGLSWVGERGPELVDLPRGSQVHPAPYSSSMSSDMAEMVRLNRALLAEIAAFRAQDREQNGILITETAKARVVSQRVAHAEETTP